MKQIFIWGVGLGLIAFVANILLPGCVEPFVDMLAGFIGAVIVVRRIRLESRFGAMRSGLMTGLVVGIVIAITDILSAGLLTAGYMYKDQLPWINLPDLSYLNSIFGNALLVFLAGFLCLGIIKMLMTLLGGWIGGAVFGSPSRAQPKTG